MCVGVQVLVVTSIFEKEKKEADTYVDHRVFFRNMTTDKSEQEKKLLYTDNITHTFNRAGLEKKRSFYILNDAAESAKKKSLPKY